jgi:nitrogen fixation protein FixH
MSTPQATHRPFTGRHMAIIMVSFFAVVIGVNLTMAMLARTSWTGLVVANSYVASQHFNENTTKLEAVLAKGHQLIISSESGRVLLSAKDKVGNPLDVASLTMTLRQRQNELQLTFDCKLAECTSMQSLDAGLWRGDANIVLVGDDVWQQAIEIDVKAK